MKKIQLLSFLLLLSVIINAKEYHVAKNGKDSNSGTLSQPFLTISAAAKIALPGDTITVHEGIYREWIKPRRGGINDNKRILYRAAPGEKVVIKGSEVISSWENEGNKVWKVTLKNDFFDDYNPYKEIIQGDWFNKKGRVHHTGEVFMNGDAFYEVTSLAEVKNPERLESVKEQENSLFQWFCQTNDSTTTIWANFQEYNPNNELVEISVRPTVFYPEKTGINYITVRGFILSQAATQWAPPTAEQIGLIGPHWSKGWIIENNVISDSKCTGISLGKDQSSGQNEWTELQVKHGTQREREVIFRALQANWSKEYIGSHIVRNNTIYNCGQAGICGHLGAVFSKIYNNHIYNIHIDEQFGGAEIAGIKLHAPIDVIIENNCIHDTRRGIWLDWQSQGTRVTRNLMFRNLREDIYTEVNHGPYIIDNNILLSERGINNISQGGAFVYNLVRGKVRVDPVKNRFTPYHHPHSTNVAGIMIILSGDDRFFNNIFIGQNDSDSNNDNELRGKHGLNVYNNYPVSTDKWYEGQSVDAYNARLLPVYISDNLYLNGAEPFNREKGAIVRKDFNPAIEIVEKKDGFYLQISWEKDFDKEIAHTITSEQLGYAFQSEAVFEGADGEIIIFNKDYKNEKNENFRIGPFHSLVEGENHIKIW